MNVLPLALSLTSSFTKVGAIAGFAALVGIALLSLLAFSQAREIKRLREWAGRAPERAAEMEQRVSTEAAARLKRTGAPTGAAAAGVAGARVVPRKTPLVSAPVSTAVNATVAAGKIGAQPELGSVNPANPVVAGPTNPVEPSVEPSPAQVNPAAPGVAPSRAAEPAEPDGPVVEDGQADPSRPSRPMAASPAPSASMPDVEQSVANGAGSVTPEADSAAEREDQPASVSSQDAERHGMSPATAAARAAGPLARSPLPPSPSAPAPPGVSASTVAGAAAAVPPASVAAAGTDQTAEPATSRPSVPMAAARPVASRAVASQPAPAKGAEPAARRPASPSARGREDVSGAPATRVPGAPVAVGPKYFRQERSAGRMTLLILGGVVLGAVLIVVAVSVLKGGGKASPTVAQPSTPSTVVHTKTPAPASNPGELDVAVLNGTSTNGLAHHLADDLQQSGYKHAEASSAVPPGTHATTVVQYSSGHRADGQAVAKALDVTRVKPMEASTASLASHATVVVVAGADQAAQLGGGGAQSTGEPSSGASGEGGTGAGAAPSGSGATGEGTGVGAEGAAGSGQ